jgi:DNA-binding transcriptional LysR family regulator
MDLRGLRHFAVLADELHFHRAAEILGTAQPTLSHQMSALEKDLGLQLFDRTKRSVRLTNAGATLREEVRGIFKQIDDSIERVRAADAGQRGTLFVGASSLTVGSHLPAVTQAFRKTHPDALLKLRITHSDELVEQLKAHQIDVALGRNGIRAGGINSRLLWQHPYRLVLPVSHPQSRQTTVALSRLKGETLITYPRSLIGESYDELLAYCRAHGFVPRAIEETAVLDSILGLVACGLGVAILPSTRALKIANVAIRPMAATNEWSYGICAYWRTNQRSALTRDFIDVATKLPHDSKNESNHANSSIGRIGKR